ncbi:protein ALTERED SEED GERMINATION 2 [Andrographis paniculata]|uniref:protein ALTERED SEED GERMINATION 2 n=1 Tax=Andrographis paniculata TaxID=175694 RepID=UPI0021E701A0|nr:protein ALTERED SEED GERMINATION 2 [Andrographis paniculata]
MVGDFRTFDDRLHRQFFKRETGVSSPRVFSRRLSASQTLIKQIDSYGELSGHRGCVNAIEFNSTGELLISGSDDKQVKLWDWARQKLKLSYSSGHVDNIFQTRFMPFTDDRVIVTSSADCQVRLSLLAENGSVETKRLSKHQGRVHKLAVEPGSPHVFYSCGEDGFIQHYDLRSNSATKLFYCSSNSGQRWPTSSVGLNSIAIDPRNPNLFAAGGADRFARVYDIRNYQINASSKSGNLVESFCPRQISGTPDTEKHITALTYSNSSELLVSYNEELIYLFPRKSRRGSNLESSPTNDTDSDVSETDPQVYSGHRNARTVKGVSFFGPNDEYVLSGSDCGHIFIWKKNSGELVRMMVGDRHIVNQIESHPTIPILASCGIEKTIKLWSPSSDTVNPLPENVEEIMEDNKLNMDDHSRLPLTPDVIMHVLQLHRRQARVYIERRHGNESDEDGDDDDDGGEAYLLGFSDGDPLDEGGNSRDCTIS